MDDRRSSELTRTGRTSDARGRTVKMVDPKKMYLLRRHDVIEREAPNAIMDDIDPGARRGLKLAIILVIPIVLLVVQSASGFNLGASERDLAQQIIDDQQATIVGGVVAVAGAAAFIVLVRGLTSRHRRLTGEATARD